MTIRVRKAVLTDAPQIAKIHIETWQDAYKGLIPADFLKKLSIRERTAKWRKILSDPKGKGTTLVVCLEEKVLGWAAVGPCRDEDLGETVGELWGIYVHPSVQRQGLGKALLQKGFSLLRRKGFKKATLWVLESNAAGRAFYESQGWKVEGKTKSEKRENFTLDEIRYLFEKL